MLEELAKAVPVYVSSMLKFVFGPLGGYVAGLHIITTIVTTVLGTMTVVVALSFFGDFLKKQFFSSYFEKRKKFTESNRRYVTIWKKYGLLGVAFLTPVLLTPIGGTLLAISFGAQRNKLIVYMFLSASIWSVVLSVTVYLTGNVLPDFLPDFVK